MSDLNSVTLSGNLVRDPELKATPSGKSVTNLRIGTKGYGEKSVFTDVVVWENKNSADFNLAEVVAQSFSQGDRIQLVGRLDYREWTDKEGNKRSKHEVVAQDIVLPKRGETAAPADEVDF